MLGLLLFNIFIHDAFYMNLDCNICHFEDDTTIYSCRSSINVVIIDVENTLMTILTRFDQNGMVANPVKFRMIFLGNRVDTKFHINLNRKIVLEDEQLKLFGVIIGNNLNFNLHIN